MTELRISEHTYTIGIGRIRVEQLGPHGRRLQEIDRVGLSIEHGFVRITCHSNADICRGDQTGVGAVVGANLQLVGPALEMVPQIGLDEHLLSVVGLGFQSEQQSGWHDVTSDLVHKWAL